MSALAAGLLTRAGCGGVLDVRRAEPLRPGQLQAHVAATGTYAGGTVVAAATFGVRGGVAPRVDVAATVGLSPFAVGAAIDGTVALTDVDRDGFHAALAPRLGLLGLSEAYLFGDGTLGVLLGWDLAHDAQFVLSPRVGVMWATEAVPTTSLAIGVVAPSGRWEFTPAAGVAYTFTRSWSASVGITAAARLDRAPAP